MNNLLGTPPKNYSKGTFLDAIVIEQPVYTPPNNKFPKQRCEIKIYVKDLNNNNNEGLFSVIAEEAMADACACHLSRDRRLDCVYIPRSNSGKLEFIIENIVFGPGPNISINTKTKKYISGNTFGFARVVHSI